MNSEQTEDNNLGISLVQQQSNSGQSSLSYFDKAKRHLHYEPLEGTFYLLKNQQPLRQLFPDEDGYLVFHRDSSRYRIKAARVAYELAHDCSLARGKSILHKNMNTDDYRLSNLAAIPKKVHLAIKEAYRNLSGTMRIVPHSSDVFSYRLIYRENNQERAKVIQDIVVAKKEFIRLQLRFAKLLSKYCVFD